MSAEERKKQGKGRVDEPDKNIRSGAEAVRPELRSGYCQAIAANKRLSLDSITSTRGRGVTVCLVPGKHTQPDTLTLRV